MNRKKFLAGVALGIVVLAVVAYIIHALTSAESNPTEKPGGRLAASPAGSSPSGGPTSQAAGQNRSRTFTLPAILVADNTADLYAKTSGYVNQLKVDIGSRVRKGDVLFTVYVPETHDELRQREAFLGVKRATVEALKAKVVQAQLTVKAAEADQKRVEAELALSQVTYDRKAELFQGKAIPAQELDDIKSQLEVSKAKLLTAQAVVASAQGAELAAEADVKAAEADVALAEADVARLKTLIAYETVAAAFDGVITRRNVDVGWFVRSAAQGNTSWLLTLDKMDVVRVVVYIPEAQAPFVRAGGAVQVQIQSFDAAPFPATVSRTAVAIGSDTRTMRAEVDLKNADGRLSPGMYAKVTFQTDHNAADR
jgi:HlyD family secretion protein